MLITTTPVSGGLATMRLQDPAPFGKQTSIGGAVTDSGQNVVPNEVMNGTASERNQWTAVMDFFPKGVPNDPRGLVPTGAHSSVFIRVLDREWVPDPPDPQVKKPNQTRFGSQIYGGSVNPPDLPCVNMGAGSTFVGALQLTGDQRNPPPPFRWGEKGKTALVCFELRNQSGALENPFEFESRLYRVQIIEKEVFTMGTFELRWKADLIDVTGTPRFVTGSSWVSETTVRDTYGISIPFLFDGILVDSKIADGIGPGVDGQIDTERTGTSWWQY